MRPKAGVLRTIRALRLGSATVLALGCFFGLRSVALVRALADHGVFVTAHVTDVSDSRWLGLPTVSYWYQAGGRRWYGSERIDVERQTSVVTQNRFFIMVLPESPATHSTTGVTDADVDRLRWLWILGTALLAGVAELAVLMLNRRIRRQARSLAGATPVEATIESIQGTARGGLALTIQADVPGEDPITQTIAVRPRALEGVSVGEAVAAFLDRDGAIHLASTLSLVELDTR